MLISGADCGSDISILCTYNCTVVLVTPWSVLEYGSPLQAYGKIVSAGARSRAAQVNTAVWQLDRL